MPTVLVYKSRRPDGELKVWVDYNAGTLEVASIIYDNTRLVGVASATIGTDTEAPIEVPLSVNVIQEVINAPPTKYILVPGTEAGIAWPKMSEHGRSIDAVFRMQ